PDRRTDRGHMRAYKDRLDGKRGREPETEVNRKPLPPVNHPDTLRPSLEHVRNDRDDPVRAPVDDEQIGPREVPIVVRGQAWKPRSQRQRDRREPLL